MTLKKVDIAGRQRRRHRKLAVSNYLKGLAEMITNSDKSYEDLGACDSPQPIHIFADSDTRTVKVVDYAQGISRDDMEEIFTKTGAKHKTHRKGGRSLFGKGLSDTLFSPITEQGELHSIKDNLYNYIIFVRAEDGNEFIDLKPDEKAYVVERAHVEKELYRKAKGQGNPTRESMNEAFKKYWESRVPVFGYDGSYSVPQLSIWTPIEFDRLKVEWVKPSDEIWKRVLKNNW